MKCHTKKCHMNRYARSLIFLVSLSPGLAAAVGLTAGLGTAGLGAHLEFPLRSNISARIGLNYFDYSYDISTSDIKYDADLELRTVDVLADYFPFESGFRLTAGLIFNGNGIDIEASPNSGGNYVVNGSTFDASAIGRVDGRVGFRDVAPYIGIGWSNADRAAKGWHVSADLGLMFHGTPSVSLRNIGCTASPTVCSTFASDLESERQALREEIDKYGDYPVARIGIGFRF